MKALANAVEALLQLRGPGDARVVARQRVGGGCIHHAECFELADARRVFVKSNPSPLPGIFEAEARGLGALAAPGILAVPGLIGTRSDLESAGVPLGGVPAFLALEWIEPGEAGPDFFAEFGRALATLHRESSGAEPSATFGFETDNYLGATPQPNRPSGDWCDFWRSERLGYQLELARARGTSNPELDRLGERLLDRLEDLIAEPAEPPCLLHGDLWSGNFLTRVGGDAVLIDPAVYRGRREAELAMTRLFGGFSPAFYRAYEEVWPLAEGSDRRDAVYRLYHVLNHLNLFGQGYAEQCLDILRGLVGSPSS